MIDERGRGGRFPPEIEGICSLKLAIAILETAIEDRAFLEETHREEHRTGGGAYMSITELDNFAHSTWGRFLMESVDARLVDVRTAKVRGKSRANPKKTSHRPQLLLPYAGEARTAYEWADMFGVSPHYIYDRWYASGRAGEEDWLDTTKFHGARRFKWGEKYLKVSEIARLEGVTDASLYFRLFRGATIERAVEEAKRCRDKRKEKANG